MTSKGEQMTWNVNGNVTRVAGSGGPPGSSSRSRARQGATATRRTIVHGGSQGPVDHPNASGEQSLETST